ncbi:hypothetical protein GTA08_BOTSDO05272 [Neofusicoccum parvum]|nr:hypothetical protein GTA08_BOTSDO05272 [Neofusicoccum parvum]
MSIPEQYQAFRRTTGETPSSIEKSIERNPKDLHPEDVLIRVHAVSLNFRDVAMLHGRYPVEVEKQGIPASDAAAEVVAIGSAVTDFKIGDRAAPIFDLNNLNGDEEDATRILGGDVSGVLREYAVFDQNVLVHLPKGMSWEEASTINCAGVTAWNALRMPNIVGKDKAALLEGTGGVSMFALFICLAAGIRPIITSSSDEKLHEIRNLAPEGTIGTINYKTHTDLVPEVLRLTDGKGVDIVVNNVGPSSLADNVKCLRRRGTVSLVGFLGGVSGAQDPEVILGVLMKTAHIQGIGVGSKKDFQNLNQFLEEKSLRIHSIIDRTFSFDDSKAAFDYLYSGKHKGKVVIKI